MRRAVDRPLVLDCWSGLSERVLDLAERLRVGASWEAGICRPYSVYAREKQRIPFGEEWFLYLFVTGRGIGKTWTLSGTGVSKWKANEWRRTAIIAPTQDDVRKWVSEDDESGIMAMCYAEGLGVHYSSANMRLSFDSGAKAYLYSAEKGGKLRNKQHDSALLDEMREWVDLSGVYDNLIRGLRLGRDPRMIGATTPPGVVGESKVGAKVQAANKKFIRKLMERESTRIVTGSSMENVDNLSPVYYAEAIEPYIGTRVGRQEVDGEFIDEVEGALLKPSDFDRLRVKPSEVPDDLVRVAVSVDPPGTSTNESSEAGVLSMAVSGPVNGGKPHAYLLDDVSGHMSPTEWARAAAKLYHQRKADVVFGEVNHGGDMVKSTLRSYDDSLVVQQIRASRGKHVRVAPAIGMVEQGRVHHVGEFPVLEEQLCSFTDAGYFGVGSPDRADAWAYLVQELLLRGQAHGYYKVARR